jgi:hypothetical protein
LTPQNQLSNLIPYFEQATKQITLLRSVIVLLVVTLGVIACYKIIDAVTPRLAQILARMSESASSNDAVLQLRRLETILGIIAALARAVVFGAAIYIAWQLIFPATAPLALIGASAMFAIVAGGMLSPLLRDISFGTMIIAERWYNVGDHITVEPFMSVSGVVEKLTPRMTKLRSLSGEAIWLHNQYIQGARVISRGLRTIALDVFVTDLADGKNVIEQTIRTLPTGPTMLARQLAITETEKLGDELWRITAVGQTTPGREWLIEDFAMNTIKKYDGLSSHGPSIVHGPIAHYTDPTAERRFRRSIRARSLS